MDDDESLAIQIQADISDFVASMKIAQEEMGRFVSFGVDAMTYAKAQYNDYDKAIKDVTEQIHNQALAAGLLNDVETKNAVEQKQLMQEWLAENKQKAQLFAELAKQELADKKAAEKEFVAYQKQNLKELIEAEKQKEKEFAAEAKQYLQREKEIQKEVLALTKEKNKQELEDAKTVNKEFIALDKEKARQQAESLKQQKELMNQVGANIKGSFQLIGTVGAGSLNVIKGVIGGFVQLGVGAVHAIGSAINAFKSGLSAIAQGMGVLAAPIAAIVGIGVQAASKQQDAWTRLQAVQQSSLALNDILQDRQAGYYTAMNAGTKEVDKLRKALESKTHSLERAQFVWDHAAKKTDSMRTNLEYWRMEVNKVSAALGQAAGSHKVWLGFKEADGRVTHMTIQQIDQMATSLEQYTKFTKDDIIGATAWAEMYTNISAKIMPDVISISTDMASVMGVDLKTAIIDVGEALQDPIKGWTKLKSVGVMFTDAERTKMEALVKSGRLLEAQQMILARLKLQFEGAAQAAGTTFAGSLEILGNLFRRFVEPIGEVVIPNLQRLIDIGLNFFRNFGALPKELINSMLAFTGLASGIGLAATAINLILSPIGLVVAAVAGIKLAIDNNLGGIQDTFRGIYNNIKPEIDSIVAAIGSIVAALKFEPKLPDVMPTQTRPSGPNIQQQRWRERDEAGQDKTNNDKPGTEVYTTYAAHLQATIAQAGAQIISSLQTMLGKVTAWAISEGQRLFKDAFKSLFGIDFSTAMTNVQNAFAPGTPARAVLDQIAADLKTIFDNLQGADWSNFVQGILKFGGALVLIGISGASKIMAAVSGAVKQFVDAIAEASKGNYGDLVKTVVEIGGAIAGIALATQAAGIISACAAAMWALIAPAALAAAPFVAIVGALVWINDNTDLFKDGFKGWETAFSSLGEIIRKNAVQPLLSFLAAMASVASGISDILKQIGDSTGSLVFANIASKLNLFAKGKYNPTGKIDYGNDPNAIGQSSSKAQMIGGSNGSNSAQQINIGQVIVKNPNNYGQIFSEVKKEASRQTTPIVTTKKGWTYA